MDFLINSRIGLSICFAVSGFIFFLLLLDSHYKSLYKEYRSSFGAISNTI